MKTLADYEAWKAKQQANGVGAAKIVLGQDFDPPDMVAKDMQLGTAFAQATGNPTPPRSMVKQYRPVFERQLEQYKATTVLSGAPKLASWLLEPGNADVSRDDLDNLGWWEATVNLANRAGANAAQMANAIKLKTHAQVVQDKGLSFEQILGDVRLNSAPNAFFPLADFAVAGERWIRASLADMTGQDNEALAAEAAAGLAAAKQWFDAYPGPKTYFSENAMSGDGKDFFQSAGNFLGASVKDPMGMLTWAVNTVGENAAPLAAGLATTLVTRNPAVGSGVAFGTTYLSESSLSALEFLQERDVNISTPEGVQRLLTDADLLRDLVERGHTRGLVIGAFEAAGIGLLGKTLLKNPIFDTLLQGFNQALLGATGEYAARIAAGQEVDFNEVLAEGLAGVATLPVDMGIAGRQLQINMSRAKDAENRKTLFLELSGQAQNSKLRERLPERFQQFLERATKDGPVENLFIPAQAWVTYFQGQNVDPYEMAATINGVTREDLETAVQTGGDLKIPTASYATVMAGSPHDPFMVENMKLSPDDMTVTEAMEFNEKAQDALQEAWELAEAVRRDEETYRAVETQIYDEMVGRLRTAGRSTDVATTEALLYPAFYRTMAERSGMAIEDFLAKHPLPQVRGAAPAGMQLRDADALTRTLTEARARRTAGLDKGQSLLEFISERGGILDPGGELRARDASVVKRGKGRKTLRLERRGVAAAVGDMLGGRSAGGHGFDDVARAAIEAGFMADDPTVLAYQQAQRDGTEVPDIGRALLEAIDRELRGETVAAAPVDGLDQIEEYLAGLGVSLDDDDAAIRQAMEEGERRYGQSEVDPRDAAFKRWFGDSKVVDAQGKPLVVYHGTNQEFEAFDLTRGGSATGTNAGATKAFFFTNSADVADQYAKNSGERTVANVVEYERESARLQKEAARLEKAAQRTGDWDAYEQAMMAWEGHETNAIQSDDATGVKNLEVYLSIQNPMVVDFEGGRLSADRDIETLIDEAKAAGHDGLMLLNLEDSPKMGVVSDHYAAFEPTQIKSVDNRGTFDPNDPRILYQADMMAPGGGSMRGQIAFGDAEAIVTLFQSADLSTFVHESGHFFLEALRLINTEEWSTVAEYLGVGPDGVLTVEQHEKFASEFEAYAMSGKAPSLGLRAAFEKFRAWLLSIYRKARGLNVEVSDQLRTVFDRMLATDAEILAAQRETAPDVAVTADDLGMTADQFQAFQKLRTQAKDEAAAKLLAETMAPIRRAATEAYKNERKAVRAITEKRLRDMPMFRAVQELRFGRDFDGNEIQPVKLDRAIIERDYGEGWLPQLPGSTKDGKGHKNAVFSHEGGLHPDIVAGMYGYPTGGQLLDALAKAPAIEEAIEAETDRIMRERHSDPLSDGSVQQLALDAVHGDKRGDSLAAELKALNEVAGLDRGLTVKEARETARRTLRTMRVRDASAAHRFLAAERKAGQEALRLTATVTREQMWMDRARRLVETKARSAVREGDATAAARISTDAANATTGRFNEDAAALVEAKRRQLMNHMLYAEARKVATQTEAVVDRLAKLNKPDAKLGKARNVDFVKAARAVAARFGLAAGDKAFDFTAWMDQLKFDDPVTAADLQYSIDVNSQEARHFKDLTVAEFETTAEAIDNILAVGKRSRELEIDGQRVERELAISELTDQAEPRMKERAGTKRAPTKGEKRKIDALTIGSALVRVEAWARDMDDGEAGVFTRYLVKPVMDALGLYREARTARLAQLLAIIEPRRGELLGKAVAAPELGYTFENKGELLHAILHTGNESNLEKLLIGRGWSTGLTGQQQRVTAKGKLSVDRQGNPLMTRGRVDTSKWDAMVNRLVADGTLTKEDFDTAQAIWDLMDEIKRPAQAAHRRMFGFYFKEVEAMPVVTPFGSYRGGYVPAIIDQYAAVDAGKQDAAAAMDSQMDASMFPTTGSGFTKSRVQNYRQPLALNLTMLPSHMDKVLRFTHLEPTIRQTASLIGNSQMRAVLGSVNPDAIDGILTPWLVRVARNTVETPSTSPAGRKFAGVMRALRKRVGLHTMALNIVNAAQQVTGVASAMVLVKPGRVKSAMARFAGNAGAMRAEAAEASLMMRDRLENSSRITSTRIEEIIVAPTVQGEIGKFVDRHGYVLQQAAQNLVDVVVWHAARDQAVANGMDDEAAVFEADSVVRRTQGSFNPEDISSFEAGTAFTRAFTMFYSYFNTQLNLVGGVAATTIRTLGWNAAPKLFPLYFFGVLVPAVVAEAIVQGARGELGDEDDDGYLDDLLELFIGSQVRYVAGAVPILGPLTLAAINGLNDLPYDDRLSTSPVVSTAERVARTPGSVVDAVTGEGSASKAVVDSLTTLGLIFGIPTGQLAKSAGYAVSVAEGRSEPENLIDVAEGLASGRDGSE